MMYFELEMTNSQVSGSMIVGEPSGRKLAVTFLIFTKLLLQFFLAALLAALFTYIALVIHCSSQPSMVNWLNSQYLSLFVCPAMVTPDQNSPKLLAHQALLRQLLQAVHLLLHDHRVAASCAPLGQGCGTEICPI